MRKTALKLCKLKRRQVNRNIQGCIYSNQCLSAYGNVQVCTTPIRISSTAHKSHSSCPVRETDRQHWSFVSLFWLIYEVVNRRVLPWRDMLFAVPLAWGLNSWSCRYKPFRWTHPAPPPPLWACVAVCLCVCVWRKTWQRKDLNSGSLGEWLKSRLTSAQVIAHAYGRVISGCLEPAGGQDSPLALTNTVNVIMTKWLSQHYGKIHFWNTFQLKSA